MAKQNMSIDEQIARQQHEAEVIQEQLNEAKAKDEKIEKEPSLSLEEVIQQMGQGMIKYPNLPIRICLVRFFNNRLSLPIPIDYLKRHTTEEDVAVLLDDSIGISLTLQITKSTKKDVTFKEVKNGLIGQMKGAGIYIELLEEGTVEDEIAPTHFITYRQPTPRGVMYNMVFYSINKEDASMIIGNYNCFYKDVEIWENIIKATITYMDFH